MLQFVQCFFFNKKIQDSTITILDSKAFRWSCRTFSSFHLNREEIQNSINKHLSYLKDYKTVKNLVIYMYMQK